MKPTTILIADDHEVIRQGLTGLIAAAGPKWEICGTAADGYETVLQALALKPDIVIMDYKMPLLDGAEAAEQITQRLPKTEVLMFTGTNTERDVMAIYRAPVNGVLLKTEAAEELMPALDALRHHHFFRSKQITALYETAVRGQAEAGLQEITTREMEILHDIAAGQASKEIAARMGISVKTVESHRSSLLRKMKARSAAELIRFAVRHGLVEP